MPCICSLRVLIKRQHKAQEIWEKENGVQNVEQSADTHEQRNETNISVEFNSTDIVATTLNLERSGPTFLNEDVR